MCIIIHNNSFVQVPQYNGIGVTLTLQVIIIRRVVLPIKNCLGKIAVKLKSHGESEIACN